MAKLSKKGGRFYPSLPEILPRSDSHQNALLQIKAALRTFQREDGNYKKSFVRWEELVELGLIDADGNAAASIAGFDATGSAGDFLINLDGSTWGASGESLQWKDTYLQLGTNVGINWDTVELLNFNGSAFTVGDPSYNITLDGQSISFHGQYTFPTIDGAANQVLATDGAGNLYFADPSGGDFDDSNLVHITGFEYILGTKQFNTQLWMASQLVMLPNYPIQWRDSGGIDTNLLQMLETGVAGTVITDEFTDYRDTFSRYNTTSSTYVDATNHFVDVSTLTDGAKYFFYLATGHCNTSSNLPNSGQRLRLTDDNGSTTMAGSEAEAGQSEAYGFAYNYAFTKTIAAAGDDIKMQIRSVGGAGNSESIGFGALGFNLDTIGAANYYEASDTNVAYGTSVTDTGVSVTVPAGDWLVFVNASFNSLNASGNGDHFLGLKDGATNKELTSFDPEFGSPEKYIKGGCRMFPSHAGGTFEVTAHGSHTGTLGRVYIFALNMAAFEETYIDVNNTPLTNPNAYADMTRSFTAPSDGDYICFGYVRDYWGSSGSTGDQEIEISVNSGAYTSYAHSHRRGDIDNGRIIHMFVYPTAVLSLTANDTVDARLIVDTPAGSSAVERWEEYSMIIMRLETASTLVNVFHVGDEDSAINRYDATEHDFYVGANQVLNIDSAGNLSIADNIPVLNSDETGAPTEDAGIEVERGTSDNVTLRWNETSDRWEFTNDGSTYYAIVTAHTGEVTGETALAVDVTAITNKTDVVAEADDDVVIHDDSDGTLKKTNLSSITDGGFF